MPWRTLGSKGLLKVSPDGTGAPKWPQAIGKSRGGRSANKDRAKIHSVVAEVNLPIARRLSPGSASDAPEWQLLMEEIPAEICQGKP